MILYEECTPSEDEGRNFIALQVLRPDAISIQLLKLLPLMSVHQYGQYCPGACSSIYVCIQTRNALLPAYEHRQAISIFMQSEVLQDR